MALGDSLHFLNPEFLSEEERLKQIEIKDIPFMYTARREIICIPKSDETFTGAIIGMSGSGKTLLLNRLTQLYKINLILTRWCYINRVGL